MNTSGSEGGVLLSFCGQIGSGTAAKSSAGTVLSAPRIVSEMVLAFRSMCLIALLRFELVVHSLWKGEGIVQTSIVMLCCCSCALVEVPQYCASSCPPSTTMAAARLRCRPCAGMIARPCERRGCDWFPVYTGVHWPEKLLFM